jgi:ATP citrate (pro-S)-lyase
MPLLDVNTIRNKQQNIVCNGSHPATIQSILEFDFLLGRKEPSIKAIIASGRKHERYFFGSNEVAIPVYASLEKLPAKLKASISLFINLVSGRRVLSSTTEFISGLPKLIGGVIFAERVPEKQALEIYELASKHNVWIIGSASVGIIIPGSIKLGAIGGVDVQQFDPSGLFTKGQVAVVSSSGGMVNELIRMVADAGFGVSFALALGGERFPITTPREAMLSAQKDPATKAIVYFGELGGDDEYEVADLITKGTLTKPVIAYIAGTVAELFDSPPQFGHAKALAGTDRETASAKRDVLRAVGVQVGNSFGEFATMVQEVGLDKLTFKSKGTEHMASRKKGIITSSISYDVDGEINILGQPLLDVAESSSFACMAMMMLLGKSKISKETEGFADLVLRLLVDHGPYVSGALNTIVTARAGRDLVSSLAAGLLTIGPRFGGAINESAAIWLRGVQQQASPSSLVEEYATRKQYISGIGHKKYRSDFPDPRVQKILELTYRLKNHPFTDFALAVEAETTQKKGNLILNIDGAIAAGLLDVLHQTQGYSYEALAELVEDEFFNALFVLSRSVGFMAHYFDQRRIDEGLLRLNDDQVNHFESFEP